MAKKIEYLDKSISEILDSSESALKRQIGKSIEQVYGTGNINYIAAYQRAVSTLAERTLRGNITQNKLEKIASLLKVREPRKETKVKGLTYEEFCEKRPKYDSFEQMQKDFPGQDLRRFEGPYNKYVLKRKKAKTTTEKEEARKDKKEIDGQEYRRLFTETFHTEDPRTVSRDAVIQFDAHISSIYKVAGGNNQLRGYRARFHKSW